MKYVINDTTLTAIGDAVREKSGTAELIPVSELATAITNLPTGGGGGIEVDPVVLTGKQENGCATPLARNYIHLFGDTVSTKDITSAGYMFKDYADESIPFELNFVGDTTYCSLTSMFMNAANLKVLPKINNVYPESMNTIFNSCASIREINDDYFEGFNFKYITNATSAYSGNMSSMYGYCNSLRKYSNIPLRNYNPNGYYIYLTPNGAFQACYSLDEIIEFPVVNTKSPITSNMLNNFCTLNFRLKNLTFETNPDGTPIEVQWKSQSIELSSSIGWINNSSQKSYILDYNSGITADKEVYDDATYAALKNDPDWFATKVEYSRYNHDSAVATINSLPDTSAYLATAGGTNTIKFYGKAGSKTDGGAINTLTEAEIAVAAAKGWTVSFT